MSTEDSKTIDFENVIPRRYRNILSDKLPSKYEVIQGPKSIFFQALKSVNQQQFASNFIINPAKSQYVSDLMIEEVQYTVTMNVTVAAAATVQPFPAGSLSICPFPNIASTNTLTTIIGNTNLVINSSKIMAAMFAYNNKAENNGIEFVDASMLDTYTDICDTPVFATPNYTVTGTFKSASNNDPTMNYSSQTYGRNGRFDIGWNTIYNNASITGAAGAGTTSNLTFVFTARSPIWNGLNSLTSDDEGTYVGLTNIQIQKTINSNLERLINYRPPANLTLNSITVTCATPPVLYFKLYNMPDNIPVPRFSQYLGLDYSGLQNQNASSTPVTPGMSFPVTSQPVNLTNIPVAIYVWLADDMNAYTIPAGGITRAAGANKWFATENSTAPGYQITAVSSIQFAGQNVVQNLQYAYQVYSELMASEGFKKTFAETGFVYDNTQTNAVTQVGLYGSVLRIDCSKLGIDWEKYANGVAVTLPFSISMQVTNLSGYRTRNPYIWIQPVYHRLYTVVDGNVDSTFSILTPDQVTQVRRQGALSIAHPQKLIGGRIHGRGLMIGSGFFGDLWNGAKDLAAKGWDSAKDIGRFAWDNKDSIMQAAKTLAPMVGLGEKKRKRKGRGIRSSSSDDDDEYTAGKILTKSEIKNKLKFL